MTRESVPVSSSHSKNQSHSVEEMENLCSFFGVKCNNEIHNAILGPDALRTEKSSHLRGTAYRKSEKKKIMETIPFMTLCFAGS